MAEADILLQNYAQILNLSITFLGIVLAIFFTLIALPLQNILGKYSQDLVNRVNRDKWLIFCFLFFIILFGYDFSLLILPKLPILISVSFLGGLISLKCFHPRSNPSTSLASAARPWLPPPPRCLTKVLPSPVPTRMSMNRWRRFWPPKKSR